MIKDLTQGKPETVLWKFSLPMFISVIFQQLYNLADSVVVGNFAAETEDALAAVGASYPITMIFMAIAVGSNIGCSVVISQFFGSKQYGKMKTAIFTTLTMSLVISVFLTALGLGISVPFMRMINTPENIFHDAELYLNIYIGGFIFLFFYNVCTGIFQAMGDSQTPLIFLIFSSLGNIFLDIWFVAGFHWDVAGVAWATFIAQGIACILAVITLFIKIGKISTEEETKFFSWDMASKVSIIAIPSILQQSFISVGNIFIQSFINSYDSSSIVAGYSAAIKFNTFAITCLTTLANGLSSFTAQNMGAGKFERVKKGFKAGNILAAFAAIPFFLLFMIAGDTMMGLFMREGTDLAYSTGQTFLQIVSPFYFLISIKLMADGVLRGSGAMKQFMAATFTDLALRVILAAILPNWMGINGIWISWPIGWIMATVLSIYFYKKGDWSKKSLVEAKM